MNEVAVAAAEAAASVGLRYVQDTMPGIRRRRQGRTFSYVGPDGALIRDEQQLARIRALAIPPAYEDVWISTRSDAHLQATARDARGRKQYRYHKRWREVRDETKYDRMLAFAEALPKIRKQIDDDLDLPGLPRRKVLASITHLLDTTSIRVGNEEYAKANNSYGLTTLQTKHVTVTGATVHFRFRGKSGKEHRIGIRDRRVARIVQRMLDIPGQELFSYENEDGAVESIDSGDVNEYIRDAAQAPFSAKDFRTWTGTVACAVVLATTPLAVSVKDRKGMLTQAVGFVATRLGNTPAVCRKAYVHPQVFAHYTRLGHLRLGRWPQERAGHLRPEEKAVLRFLQRAGSGPSLETELHRSVAAAVRRKAPRTRAAKTSAP